MIHAGDRVGVDLLGHSHIPWDSTSPAGIRLLDPGSPTDRRRQPTHTWMTAVVEDGRLVDVELHHLEGAPDIGRGRGASPSLSD